MDITTHGGALDQIRPFWEIADEPEQSQDHEEDDEQQQAMPRSGLWLRAVNPVKFHRRVPQPFQPLHQGAHPRVPSANLVRLSHPLEGLNIEKLSYGATCTARVGIFHAFVSRLEHLPMPLIH
jgi:hypothetical protein